MRITAVYVRQSADRADSVSLETQEALCRSELPPETPVTVYSDRGYSGKNTERPGLRALTDAIRRGEIGTVLVYKLDRISRNLADFTRLLELFRTHRVEFRSHTERFETASPMGQAMQSLLMVFAQLERETISGRVRDAAFARAKLGFDTGGPPPAGFHKVRGEILGRRTNILAPDENAPIISEGFYAYLRPDGSLTAICRTWNTQGFQTLHGGRWTPNVLCRVLRNPVYVQGNADVYAYLSARGAVLCMADPLPQQRGIYLYADRRYNRSRFTDLHDVLAITAPHRGTVAPEIWLGCQKKLEASRKKRTSGKGVRTWLSGMIYCMRCGSALTAVQGRSAVYLICGGRKRGKCSGAGAVWRVDAAEALAGQLLAEELERLRGAGIMMISDNNSAQIRAELDALKLRRAAILRSLSDPDGKDISLLTEAASQIAHRMELLQTQLASAGKAQAASLPRWSETDASAKKLIAQTLLSCVTADGDTLHLFLRQISPSSGG